MDKIKIALPASIAIPLAKRVFDIIFSGLTLVTASPLMLAIAILIKFEGIFLPISRGPVFYAETRISQGKPFLFRKFRIFKMSAYQPLLDRNEIVSTKNLEHTAGTVTFIGEFLKKFYLDELPQLWNVLKGDMSMVGTRPWTPPDYEKEIAKGIFRKKILKAGLTGPVQVHKHDEARQGGAHKLDNNYINLHCTKNGFGVLMYDIKILILSVVFMLKGEGL